MKRLVIAAFLLSTVPVFAQAPEEATGVRELGAFGEYSLGNLAARDVTRLQDPVQQLKMFFAGVNLPLTANQEQKLNSIVEAEQKDVQALHDGQPAGNGADAIRKLNQQYLNQVNAVLLSEQQNAWRHYRVEQIRLRGGFPALKLVLQDADVPLTEEQEKSIQQIFANFDARRAALLSNATPAVAETDRLVLAEFNRVAAVLSPEQRKAVQASRRSVRIAGKIQP